MMPGGRVGGNGAKGRVAAQEGDDLGLALLPLQRAGAVDQTAAGLHPPGGGVQQPVLDVGQLGHVGGAGGAQHFRVAAKGAGGGAGGVQQHGVEPTGVFPVLRRNRHDLCGKAGALQVLRQPLQPPRCCRLW